MRITDPLASTIHQRQHKDWRELRFKALNASAVRRALESLAREIVRARKRAMPDVIDPVVTAAPSLQDWTRRYELPAELRPLARAPPKQPAVREALLRGPINTLNQAADADPLHQPDISILALAGMIDWLAATPSPTGATGCSAASPTWKP